jgi:hypothetical protein
VIGTTLLRKRTPVVALALVGSYSKVARIIVAIEVVAGKVSFVKWRTFGHSRGRIAAIEGLRTLG